MKTLPLRLAFLFVVLLFALSAVPALALGSPGFPVQLAPALAPVQSTGTNVVPMVVWSIVAVVITGIIFGTLYLLKRRVGGFPAHPTWVAPITIMPSKDFADEGAFPESSSDSHH